MVISAYNPDLKLKPGLTANVTIYTLEKEHALAVPTKALRFVPDAELLSRIGITVDGQSAPAQTGKRELWVKNGDTLVPRTVSAGASSGELTEITEGLADGEVVAIGLSAASEEPAAASVERSPFMPSPPGGDKGKKQQAR